jgi:regulator of sigma E protease
VTLLWFVILVGVLITVHELGHLIAARLLGIGVLKFSIGFGPALVSIRRGGTEYALSVIPFGGYVRLVGEDADTPLTDEERPRSFSARPAWQRLAVICAGPAANLIFPVLVFVQLAALRVSEPSATIGAVLDGQPAAAAGLRPGDVVTAVDDEPVRTWDELSRRVTAAPGHPLRITVERASNERAGARRTLTKYVIPRAHVRRDALGRRETIGLLGIAPHVRLPQIGVEPDGAAYAAGLRTFDLVTSIQGRPVEDAADLGPLLRPRDGGMLLVTYLRPRPAPFGFAQVATLEAGTAQVVPRAVARPGRAPVYDSGAGPGDLFVAAVEPGTPAARLGGVGLRRGDRLLALDGVALGTGGGWEAFAQALEERPEAEHRLRWRGAADGVEHEAAFRLEARSELDEYHGEATAFVFGAEGGRAIRPIPEVPSRRGLFGVVGEALGRAGSVISTLVYALGLTLTGRLPTTSIGGPILIYEAAGVAAQHGLEHFLVMAALVSLNIGLLNLLPVPVLDGGQAALVLVEAVRRRRISAQAIRRASFVGVALLVALLLLASKNDIVHLLVRP